MCEMCNKELDVLNPKSYKEETTNFFFRKFRRNYIKNTAVYTSELVTAHTLKKEDKWKTSKLRNKKFIGNIFHGIRHYMLEKYAYKIEGAQVVPLELALQIVDLNDYIVKKACMCRQVYQNRREDVCLTLGLLGEAEYAYEREDSGCVEITQDEAKEVILDCNKKGYVHTMLHCGQNYRYAICNCEYPGCFAMKVRKQYNWTGWFQKSDFMAVVTSINKCSNCGICLKQCPFEARSLNGGPKILEEKCFGCGLCITNCPNGVATLINKKTKHYSEMREVV